MTDQSEPSRASADSEAGFERTFTLQSISLSGLRWQRRHHDAETPRHADIVGLHGWLDNAATFARLAPYLSELAPVEALDLAGHGHSGHRPTGHGYLIADYVADLAEYVSRFHKSPINLVGHSLGGVVSLLYAAAFPERVNRLVLIDSLGPPPSRAEDSASQLRKGIERQLRGSSRRRLYGSIEDAVRDRAGGFSPLSEEAAKILVERNLEMIGDSYRWRTDPRLRYPSLMRYDEAQIEGLLAGVECPVLLIKAENSILDRLESLDARRSRIQNLHEETVPGGHHCHLDGAPQRVASSIESFFNEHKD